MSVLSNVRFLLLATASAFSSAHFGQGSGLIHMDDVRCAGHESHLTHCSFLGSDRENCGHYEDAGVRCK